MSRRHFLVDCEGDAIACTLDEAPGKVGLLIVSGGNETRAGAFSGQSQLAARIAAAGFPVLRFDRRGVGDSGGENGGFEASEADVAKALLAFEEDIPGIAVVGFGNCDAASALLLNGGSGCSALVLANPWTFDAVDEAPPPDAVRRRYVEKLKNPRELVRLLTGGVSLSKLAGGIRRALSPPAPPSSLAEQMRAGLATYAGDVRFLIAENDRTGQAFMSAIPETEDRWHICENAGHSFAEDHARDWLYNELLAALHEQARQLDMG